MTKLGDLKSIAENFSILYVEDEEKLRKENKKFFKNIFFKVDIAQNGKEGMELYNKNIYDIVISDIVMPEMNGIEMSQKIKEINPEQDIIIVSAYSDANYLIETIKIGVDDYIMKPVNYKQILDVLYKVSTRIKTRKELREYQLNLEKVVDEKSKALQEFNSKFDEMLNSKTQELKKINKNLEKFSSDISKYLSPQIYHSIVTENKRVEIGSSRKKLTVFLSDIVNFTKTTQELEPEDLTFLLNGYLESMSKIALKYNATIDKFIGDAILIFFGDPKSKGTKEDAKNCVLMAIEMREKMKEFREDWKNKGISQPFHIRMGISTAFCTVGNFGSKNLMDYTIIGSGVNLASRLESNAEIDEILISEETYLLIKDSIKCQKHSKVTAKGFQRPIQTYIVSNNKTVPAYEILDKHFNGFSIYADFEKLSDNKNNIKNILQDIIKKLN